MKHKKKSYLVAMSGGIDSSLAACLLKQKGFTVLGATMKLWPSEQCSEGHRPRTCCSLTAIEDARRVAAQLNIPHYVFDFHKEFKEDVIDYFCRQYIKGFTPNPCIVCNQKIKFDLLLKKAKMLGCEYIATGHYAKVGYNRLTERYFIKEGKDKKKDQSYFLSFVSQKSLAKTIFPLENMTKSKSRRLARNLKLEVHNKKSSQEVCFIPSHYSDYIGKWNNADFKEGDIMNSKGKVIGRHKGIHLYTLGQRKGMGIAHKEPLYVVSIDKKKNSITVGRKSDLMKKIIAVKDPCWGPIKDISRPLRVMVKIRYGHNKSNAVVEKISAKELKLSFSEPQEAPTPGQAAVFYKNDTVLGGGWIEEVLE